MNYMKQLWKLVKNMVFNLDILHQLENRGGMLSYHADADINTNPFELGLDRLVNLESDVNFIGKEALKKIKKEGIKRIQVGLEIDCEPLSGPNTIFWPILNNDLKIGKVTSAVYSPRLKKNIALAMIDIQHSKLDTKLITIINEKKVNCRVVENHFLIQRKNSYFLAYNLKFINFMSYSTYVFRRR